MVRVGVIGIGMMGGCHLDVYGKMPDVQVVAVADRLEERRSRKATTALNLAATASAAPTFEGARQYVEGAELIADADVDLVDICVPTPQHVELALAALAAGKHVLMEKPASGSSAEAQRLIPAAKHARGMIMCAMCMRFWPGWSWLKEAITSARYGRLLAAQFRRVSNFPGRWYGEAKDSGGEILDLHIHDTDFIHWCLGMPRAVRSVGYGRDTAGIDHVVTQYEYPHVPMVVAEGGWSMADGFGFQMQYCVNFERATAVFDLSREKPLRLIVRGEAAVDVELPGGMGYDHEIRYFVDCIAQGRKPAVVTLEDAVNTLRIIEAERQSVLTGERIAIEA